jgi:hypothetical protein
MNKLSGADVRWLLNCFFFKARFKVRLFACVGNHLPCFRLHCLPSLLTAELAFSNSPSLLNSKSNSPFRKYGDFPKGWRKVSEDANDEEVSEIGRLKDVLIELRLDSPCFEQILGNVLPIFMLLRPFLQRN